MTRIGPPTSANPESPVSLLPLVETTQALKRARLGQSPSKDAQKELCKLVRVAGPAVIPALLRSLDSDSIQEADLAAVLLCALDVNVVSRRLGNLVGSSAISDRCKTRAVEVLATMGAPIPDSVTLKNPDLFVADTLIGLLSKLDTEDDFRHAVGEFLKNLGHPELLGGLRVMLQHGGERGAKFVRYMMADLRTPWAVVSRLALLVRPAESVKTYIGTTFVSTLSAIRSERCQTTQMFTELGALSWARGTGARFPHRSETESTSDGTQQSVSTCSCPSDDGCV